MAERYYPNRSDWSDQFWANNYMITVTTQGIEFIVNADCSGDAIDEVIDYCAERLPGLLWSPKEEYELEFPEDYVCGGNEGRRFRTLHVKVQKL